MTRVNRKVMPWLLLLWASTVAPASAEWFGDLYLGGALTGTGTQDIDADVAKFRHVRFDTSLAVGGRGGYWFEDFDYLGLALDVVHFRPDVGAQTVRTDQGGPLPLAKLDLEVFGLSIDLLLRYPLWRDEQFPTGRLQPYALVGPLVGITTARDTTNFGPPNGQSHTSSPAGFNVGVGLLWALPAACGVLCGIPIPRVPSPLPVRPGWEGRSPPQHPVAARRGLGPILVAVRKAGSERRAPMPTVTAPGWRTQTVVVGLAGLLLVSGCTAIAENAQVFDADGKRVGPLLRSATATSLMVRVRTGEATAALRLRQAGLIADGMLYYDSTDCSGTPFLDALSVVAPGHVSTLLASTAIGAPGRTVYVAVPYGWVRSIRVGSFSVNETCYFAEPFAKRVIAARPLADLTTQFTPPFSIQSSGL